MIGLLEGTIEGMVLGTSEREGCCVGWLENVGE